MNQQPPIQTYSYSTSSSTSRKTKIGSDGQTQEEISESSESSGNVPPDFDSRFQRMGLNAGEGFPSFPQSSLFRGMDFEEMRSPMSPLSIQTMRNSPLRSSPQPQAYTVSSPASTLRSSPAPPPSTPADPPQPFNGGTMSSPHYKTELFIPVKRHQNTFDDFHMNRWLEHNNSLVDSQFTIQRDDWQNRLEDLKRDFFSFSPHGQSESAISSSGTVKQSPSGKPEFSVQFDVKHFKPEEINVSTKHGKLIITAMHEEKVGNSSSRRQVNRQVDIPNDVQIGLMRSILSKDGILSVTAPIKPPSYTQPQICPGVSASGQSAGQVTQTHTKSYSSTPMPTVCPMSTGSGMMVAQQTASQDALDWTVNVAGFKPQEVNVTVQGRKVIVHACHDEQQGGKKSHNEMRKQFDLPDSVSAENVRSFIRDGNILHIEASLRHDLKGRIELVPVNYKV